MRSEDDIQRAHDLVTGLFLDAPALAAQLPVDTANDLKIFADTLCWVLEHSHNKNTETNLTRLERWIGSQGFRLGRMQ